MTSELLLINNNNSKPTFQYHFLQMSFLVYGILQILFIGCHPIYGIQYASLHKYIVQQLMRKTSKLEVPSLSILTPFFSQHAIWWFKYGVGYYRYSPHVAITDVMLRYHCRAIRYERHDWPFVADRGISLKFQVWIRGDEIRYVLIRFVARGCDLFTICQFQGSRSVTVLSSVQIRSHTFR